MRFKIGDKVRTKGISPSHDRYTWEVVWYAGDIIKLHDHDQEYVVERLHPARGSLRTTGAHLELATNGLDVILDLLP